jgi:hypothetical protein
MPCPANELGIVEPFVAIENSEASIGSAVSVDGACVLMARSGTACRAPTGKNKDENQERCRGCAKQRRGAGAGGRVKY